MAKQTDRKDRYLNAGAGAGLIRVEVLVPPEGRETILKEAGKLRSAHRHTYAWNDHLEALFQEALARFGTRCLWNAKPTKSIEGIRVIVDRLRKYGGMDAWRLAAEIKKELPDAS
jgi:hypothetical protein